MLSQRVIIDTTVKSVESFDIRGRGRLLWAVVNAPHIEFVCALGATGAQLMVDGIRIEGFEIPHVSNAADALASFTMLGDSMPPTVNEGARVLVVVADEK